MHVYTHASPGRSCLFKKEEEDLSSVNHYCKGFMYYFSSEVFALLQCSSGILVLGLTCNELRRQHFYAFNKKNMKRQKSETSFWFPRVSVCVVHQYPEWRTVRYTQAESICCWKNNMVQSEKQSWECVLRIQLQMWSTTSTGKFGFQEDPQSSQSRKQGTLCLIYSYKLCGWAEECLWGVWNVGICYAEGDLNIKVGYWISNKLPEYVTFNLHFHDFVMKIQSPGEYSGEDEPISIWLDAIHLLPVRVMLWISLL